MLSLEDLNQLHDDNRDVLNTEVPSFTIGGRTFDFNREPAVMGVVNLSTDSWYRESVCMTADQAIRRGITLASQGAAFIDIGAESTLEHAERFDDDQQKSQLLPVLQGLHQEGVLTSIETYYPAVARQVLAAGADIINMTGAEESQAIYQTVAEHDAAVIVCYYQGKNARDIGEFSFGDDVINLMYEYFAREIELATNAGVSKIFVDAGLGFYYKNLQDSAVRVRYQMMTFLNSFRLRSLGFPVCHALPHAFEYFGEEVRTAEGFFAVLAALGKTDLFRTHEVPRVKAVLDTMALY